MMRFMMKLNWISLTAIVRSRLLLAMLVLLAPVFTVTAAGDDRTGKEIVDAVCGECHGTGINGAPKIGDHAAWIPRVKHGLDPLVLSAIRGHGGMPARGGVADLTDNEVRNAIIYMFTGSK
jgi:cytochrome c5